LKSPTNWVFEEGSFRPAAKLTKDKKYSIITDCPGTPAQMYDEQGQVVWEAFGYLRKSPYLCRALFRQIKMNTKVDMTYRFLWDEEPTDEQLQALMEEVGEDVRRESKRMEQQIKEKLEEEYASALAARQKQV
jgi:hypothetical protein